MKRMTHAERYEAARRNRTPEQQASIDDLHAALYEVHVDDIEHDRQARRELIESHKIFVAVEE